MRVWRLGHKSAPCDFVPRRLCHWNQRFDDPKKEYRTLYCAEKGITCLYEVLADMRPNTKARQEFNRFFPDQDELIPVPSIHRWRKEHVLAEANIVPFGRSFVHVEDLKVRHQLENELADLMERHGIDHLNISEIRSKNRHITRAISRTIFESGDSAGIEFHSNLDSGTCYALFEGRSKLHQIGKVTYLNEDVPVLVKVCKEYGIDLN